MGSIFSTKESGGFANNLAYAIVAQGVGLLSSVLTSLILPKLLGVEDYAYWQLFLLYASYVGLALLGVNDGIYLRLGGKRYSELDFSQLKGQELVVLFLQLAIAVVCVLAVLAMEADQNKVSVFCLVIFYGVLANLTSFFRYIFQCTNLTRISSFADLLSKGLFVICMIGLLLVGVDKYLPFVSFYALCQAVSLAYVLICAKDVLNEKASFKGVLKRCVADIKAGMKIMVAYYADLFVIGFTRILTEARLGLAVFGKLSLAISLTNFFLTFIGQVAMVAFPVLKRLSSSQQREKYIYIRRVLQIILPTIYLLYVPVRFILVLWLPEYEESFIYLAFTLPICVYSCKANLLFNTFLKIDRQESRLCIVNVVTMLINALLSLALIDSQGIIAATVGIVVSLAMRDYMFERYFGQYFHIHCVRQCLLQALFAIGFMLASWSMGAWSILPVIAMLLIYWAVQKGDASFVAHELSGRFKASKPPM